MEMGAGSWKLTATIDLILHNLLLKGVADLIFEVSTAHYNFICSYETIFRMQLVYHDC